MNKFVFCCLSAVAFSTVATVSRAELTLDVGYFGYNYQNTSQTRGFWFTAPLDFTITGLQVPTEVGTDVQNIEVFTLSSAPASFVNVTPSSEFNLLGYFQGVDTANYIATNFSISAGEVVCILGARGTTTMNNAYTGDNTYVSSVGGMSITLTRLGYQGNLNAGAASGVFTEPGLSYAQVNVLYVVPEPSIWALLGVGGAGLSVVALHRRRAIA